MLVHRVHLDLTEHKDLRVLLVLKVQKEYKVPQDLKE